MSTASQHIFDATRDNFETDVLKASLSTPILIDFWAAWCEPCKALSPLLDKLADEYHGAFQLAKVDVEAEQELAGMFGIRSIPTVMLIKDGQMLDGFAGALTEGQVREFLGKHVQPASAIEMPEPAAATVAHAVEPAADAVARLQHAIATHPDDASLKLDLALALVRTGNNDAARAELDALPANLSSDARAERLRGQLALAQNIDARLTEDSLRARIQADPADWTARDQLGMRLVLGENPAAGLDEFLHILKHQRDGNDGQAKKRLLASFQILDDAALIGDYRRRMAALLF